MCIDVCSGRDITVSEPFLNLFQAYPMREKHGSAAVPQIVEAFSGIGVDQPDPIGVLQAFTDICVSVDYCVG